MSKGGGSSYTMQPSFSTQTSDTSTKIPDWLTSASQQGIGAASNLLNGGTPQYNGQLYPGLTADQQSAQQMFQNAVGQYQPQYQQAQGYTNQATQQGPQINAQTYANGLQNLGQYMNPYISDVVNSVDQLGQQNLSTALNQTSDQAIGSGAYGGSRHGVQEGVATAQNNLNTNNLLANLLSSGYTQATGLMGQDISNNLQAQGANQNAFQSYMQNLLNAGQQTSANATASRAANVGDINNVAQSGAIQQQTQAAQDQAAQNMWQYQNQYPFNALSAYNQTVQGAPHSTNQSTTTTGYNLQPVQNQQSNPLSTALGLGLGAASLYSSGGLSGLGGLLGLGGATGVVGGLGAGRSVPTFY